jgi:hypothetical protein
MKKSQNKKQRIKKPKLIKITHKNEMVMPDVLDIRIGGGE